MIGVASVVSVVSVIGVVCVLVVLRHFCPFCVAYTLLILFAVWWFVCRFLVLEF